MWHWTTRDKTNTLCLTWCLSSWNILMTWSLTHPKNLLFCLDVLSSQNPVPSFLAGRVELVGFSFRFCYSARVCLSSHETVNLENIPPHPCIGAVSNAYYCAICTKYKKVSLHCESNVMPKREVLIENTPRRISESTIMSRSTHTGKRFTRVQLKNQATARLLTKKFRFQTRKRKLKYELWSDKLWQQIKLSVYCKGTSKQ